MTNVDGKIKKLQYVAKVAKYLAISTNINFWQASNKKITLLINIKNFLKTYN